LHSFAEKSKIHIAAQPKAEEEVKRALMRGGILDQQTSAHRTELMLMLRRRGDAPGYNQQQSCISILERVFNINNSGRLVLNSQVVRNDPELWLHQALSLSSQQQEPQPGKYHRVVDHPMKRPYFHPSTFVPVTPGEWMLLNDSGLQQAQEDGNVQSDEVYRRKMAHAVRERNSSCISKTTRAFALLHFARSLTYPLYAFIFMSL
jgi:hypothetical protein